MRASWLRTLVAVVLVISSGVVWSGVAATPARAAWPLPPGTWNAGWWDDFDGTSLDTTKWATYTGSYEEGCRGNSRWGKQSYVQDANVAVANGTLTLTARRETVTHNGVTYPWTSGLVTTGDACGHDPSYGAWVQPGMYVEIHARIPGTVGMWPAFYTWNAGGNEVDVFEYHPDQPRVLELTNHTVTPIAASSPDFGYDLSAGTSEGWHYFGVVLGANSVDWYLDGQLVWSDNQGFKSWGAYLIVTVDVADGTLGHPVPAPSATEAHLVVDSVRVYSPA